MCAHSAVSLPTELWQDKIAESMQEAERLCIQYEAECNSHKVIMCSLQTAELTAWQSEVAVWVL